MRYSILGFNQKELLKNELDLTDTLLLDYIYTACASPSMKKTHDADDQPYVWLKHSKIHEDLPIIGIGEEMLKKRLRNLTDKGLIKSVIKTDETRGRRAYYTITALCESLRFSDQAYSITLDSERPSVIHYTSDNKLNINNNKLNSNSTNVELEQSTTTQPNHTKRRVLITEDTQYGNTQSSNKENKKVKKKNLYEKCTDIINEYTEDEDIRKLLVTYLNVRLERKDKPFGATSFKGTVHKLDKLAKTKEDKLEIIQYSIDRSYPSFYELHKYKKKDVFGERGQVFSRRSNEEDVLNVQF